MKILILNGCWTPNIGNAFVNLGTEQIVKKAFGECEIVYSADVANKWFFAQNTIGGSYSKNSFNISKYMDIDLVVWGGMILTKYNFELAQDIFMEFSNREIPILFLGAGADEYSSEEAEYVATCLKQLKYVGIITRDDTTYKLLGKYEYLKWRIVDGIDAAFFVSECVIPKLDIDRYDVECFDRIVAPYIDHEGKKIIFSHHDCNGKLPTRYINQKDTLISELPYDYLTIYKNVDTTYAERVHACIATLAFGNKAMLFSNTVRADLFDKVLNEGSQKIRRKPIFVDKVKLDKEKKRMVENVKIFYEAFKNIKKKKEHADLLQVYIETISACNRKCEYCYYASGADTTNNGKKMSEETFDKIINDLAKINYSNLIYLYDINEPLLDKRIPYFIKKIAEKLPNAQIYIFSNGDLATEELIEEYFRNGLTHFVFSLHDHKNDEKIKRIIRKFGKEKFTIADMTILKSDEFMNRGGSITDEKIASQERHLECICELPFRQVLVNPDGDYRLCCSIRDEVLLGNINETNIVDYFYNSPQINYYRDELLRKNREALYPCKDCSFSGENIEGIKMKLGSDYQLRQAIYEVSVNGLK